MTRTPQSAKNKVLEYLASRDHSEKELREKLSRKFSDEEVEEAIQSAHASNLIRPPEELARIVAATLQRKKKSYRFIKEYLSKKGLPPVEREMESEMEKARELIQQKFRKGPPFSFEEKPKVHRYLAYRGFDSEIIRKVMHERE